jgi:hypothetical protein
MSAPAIGLYTRHPGQDPDFPVWTRVAWFDEPVDRGEVEEHRILAAERGNDTALVETRSGFLPSTVSDPLTIPSAEITVFPARPR